MDLPAVAKDAQISDLFFFSKIIRHYSTKSDVLEKIATGYEWSYDTKAPFATKNEHAKVEKTLILR